VSGGFCEVSTATRLLGDRWSLLIVRELAVGNTRFTEIHQALPGLSRSLLASRLRYLERLSILERQVTGDFDRRSLHRYGLTEVGWALIPALRALGDWAQTWQAAVRTDEPNEVALMLEQMQQSIAPSLLPNGRVAIQWYFAEASDKAVYLRADRSGVRACVGLTDAPDLIVRSTPATLNDLYWGRRTCRDAIGRRDITFEGPIAYAQAFPGWFPNRPAVRGPRSSQG
jgi:DNA-binding HxlR family transcriptional regulator